MKIAIKVEVMLAASDRGQAFVKIMDHETEIASGNSGLLYGVSYEGLAKRALANAISSLKTATAEAERYLRSWQLDEASLNAG